MHRRLGSPNTVGIDTSGLPEVLAAELTHVIDVLSFLMHKGMLYVSFFHVNMGISHDRREFCCHAGFLDVLGRVHLRLCIMGFNFGCVGDLGWEE